MIKMICLILGGGQGSRLYPLTKDRSKPAVPIGGKYRLIDIPLSNCINSGVRRMFVLTQFNSASLNQHIKNTYNFDHFSNGFVNILAAEQTPNSEHWYQGTADAVRQSMHHVDSHDYDYVLILSGDQLYQMDFEALAKYHVEKGADITIATIPVNAKDATSYGIMKVNPQGYISGFVEKPAADLLPAWKSETSEAEQAIGKDYLASMGIYIFSKKALKTLFADHPKSKDFGKEIIPDAIKSNYRVASYQFSGYWEDIGTVASFFEANLEMTDPIPPFNLFDNEKIIYTRGRMLPPTKMFGTVVNQSVISEGGISHANSITRSVIGIRSRIGAQSTLKNVYMMGADYYETVKELMQEDVVHIGVGENCHIENAILDKNCRVGDNVTIVGHPELENVHTDNYSIVDGIVTVVKGGTIKAGSKIGFFKK